MLTDRIQEQLGRARQDLDYIRTRFKDEPNLLAVFEPSALHLIALYEAWIELEGRRELKEIVERKKV